MLNLLDKRLGYAWRVVATGISFSLFGLGALLIGVLSAVFILPLPFASASKQFWVRSIIRQGCKFFILTMRTLGLLSVAINRSTQGAISGHIIIANHPTLLDAIFMIAEFSNVCCIVKQGLWRNPLTSIAVNLAGYIPNSSEQLVGLARKRLEAGENILIFPEGTRNCCDRELLFKRGAANIAVMAFSPILPVLINCSPRTLQKGEKWYHVPVSPPRFTLRINSAIRVADCIDVSRPRTVQYRHLTRYLREYYRSRMSGNEGACFEGVASCG